MAAGEATTPLVATTVCRAIRPSEVAQVARVLSDSFQDTPMSRYLFPNPHRRSWALHWWFVRRLRVCSSMGATVLGLFDSTSGDCVSTLTLGCIAAQTPPLWLQLWNGLLLWPLLWGLPSLLRLLELAKKTTAASEATHGRNTLELMMVATAPAYQGKGHMRQLLKQALGQLPPHTSVGLTTQESRNVRMYEKVGFRVTGEADLFPGFHNWWMKLST